MGTDAALEVCNPEPETRNSELGFIGHEVFSATSATSATFCKIWIEVLTAKRREEARISGLAKMSVN
jgi:hypothetical protein